MQTTDPLALNYIEDGEIGHPVLLVHDLGASLHDWEALIPPLVISGHHTYACDLPGHGRSPSFAGPRQNYAQMYVTALRQWVDSLELGRSPVCVGHGFGAYLCLRYALGHPYKVSRLILINPLLGPEQYTPALRCFQKFPWLEELSWQFLPHWTRRQVLGLGKKETQGALAQRIWTDFCQSPAFGGRIPATLADLSFEIQNLPTRSLFLVGEDDPLLDMSALPMLLEDMANVSLVTLPGAGHRPHLQMPEETIAIISSFLFGF